VKVRRTQRSIDLRNLPLDGFDMFLLTQLESTLSLQELLDIAPCDHDESLRRLHQLVAFQLVELECAPGESLPKPRAAAPASRVEPAVAPRAAVAPPRMAKPTPVAMPAPVAVPGQRGAAKASQVERIVLPQAKFEDEDTSTLRPPPSAKKRNESRVMARVANDDDAATLRPPAPLAVKDMMREAEESTVQKVMERSSGVVEKKSAAREFETPRQVVAADGRVVKDRSVFSRATLVDEDVQERARELVEPMPRGRRA
jgi:hypothetical protein